MPLDSIEVRWFIKVAAERWNALKAVLTKLGTSNDRPDEYAVISGARDFGIKVRGAELRAGKQEPAQLDLKGRTGSLGLQVFGNGVVGRVECWTKWSYRGDALDLLGACKRVRITKQRVLRKFALEGGGFTPVEAKTAVSKGGAIEITLLGEAHDGWLTLGAEAFPTDPESIARFPDLVNHLVSFASEGGVGADTLVAETSASYPSWLADRTLNEQSPDKR